jgi:Tfp pilus assembly protein PilZ
MTYWIAKSPPYLAVKVDDIITNYGAVNFLYYLDQFIKACQIKLKQALTTSTRFPVFHQVILTLPPPPIEAKSALLKDVICMTPAEAECHTKGVGIKPAKAAKTSSVLIHLDAGLAHSDAAPLAGE